MIKFNRHDGIKVYADVPSTDPEDPAPDLASFYLDWTSNPKAFVAQLREMANFIEHHAASDIEVVIE